MTNKKKSPQPKKTSDNIDLRGLSEEEQIHVLRGSRVERTFNIDTRDIDEENRTVWLSISSERPYERWWGVEILDHTKASIDTERLANGAPLLVEHDRADQVGVIEDYSITADKKIRVKARFGRSDRATEIFQDILDGVRRNTSVGYVINDLVLEKSEGEVNHYRVTSWAPFEGSVVSVPADPSVGVGRNDQDIKTKLNEVIMKKDNKPAEADGKVETPAESTNTRTTADVSAAEAKAEQRAMQRVNDIMSLGGEFESINGPELARTAIKDGTSVEDFRAELLDKFRGAQKPFNTAEPAQERTPHIEVVMHQKPITAFKGLQLKDGSMMRAEEQAFRAGQWVLANVFGNEKARQYCREKGIQHSRVMHSDAQTVGGALVPVELEQAIIDLRDSYGIARQLATVRTMSSDTLEVPRRTGGLTTYYMKDSDDSAVTASDKSWGMAQLVTKKLAGLGVISSDTVEDAIIDAVNDLVQELAWAFAKAEDEAFIDGDGTSSYGGITGFRTLMADPTNYASGVDATTGDDTFAEIILSDLHSVMGAIAAYAKPGAVWLCSETAKSLIFDRLMAAGGGNTTVTLGDRVVPMFLGYPIVTSEAMPAGASTNYNNAVMVAFGNFKLSTSLGSRRDIGIQILREAYATKGQIGVLGTQRYDILHHDLGDSSTKGPVATLTGKTS